MEKVSEWASRNTLWILLVPAFIVLFFTFAVPVYSSFQPGRWQIGHDINGSIGDFFGGIMNPVIAFMALVWLVKGVRLQQIELAETKAALQASEKHQAAQVRITAISALIASINDEHARLRAYRQSLEAELAKQIKEHDLQQAQMEPHHTLSLDEHTAALLEEFNALERTIKNYEHQRHQYLAELKEILNG
ncbi:hypothetical protein [Achromobacter mucicolens]|uniref:hypothetical protein n=1 Tax=Achromobacter mucicolens TaxID=1389922 RepID=UPI003974ACE6